MSYVFLPTVDAAMEASILGLHACGARQHQVATPMDLGIMMAALLRNPEAPPPVSSVSPRETRSRALNDQVALGNVRVVARMPLRTETVYDDYNEVRGAEYIIRNCANVAILHQSAPAFIVAVSRFDALLPNAAACRADDHRIMESMVHQTGIERFLPGCPSDRHAVATLEALRCVKVMPEGSECCYVDMEQLRSVEAKFNAADRAAREGLPLGDVAVLLKSHDGENSAVALVSRLLTHCTELHTFTVASAIKALIELGRADIAAMLFSTAGEALTAREPCAYRAVQREARQQEMRTIVSVHGPRYIHNGLQCSPLHVLKAFDGSGVATVKQASPDCLNNLHVLLVTPKLSPGAPAYHDEATFRQRWAASTRGLLDGWDWNHCIASGGAVVRALVGDDVPERDETFGDIDLFFYGLPDGGLVLQNRVKALADHVRAKVGADKYSILLTSKNVTIVIENAPRIQVATGLWRSVDDVLSTADIDCCGVGYDGHTVVMTGRAAAAYAVRGNVASASRHGVRGSIHFEMRLWKYATRYGFCVIDPLHVLDTHAELIATCRAEIKGSFGYKRFDGHAAQRHAATTLNGIYWLMAADAGFFRVSAPKDDLAVSATRHVADVVATVKEEGYHPSDGYGTHESGYQVVIEGDPATHPRPAEVPSDGEDPCLPWFGRIFNCNFHLFVPFTDHDGHYTFSPHDWVLESGQFGPIEPPGIIEQKIQAAVKAKKRR